MIRIQDIHKHQFLGNSDFPRLTWDEVIFNFNKSVVNNLPYRTMNNFGFVTHDNKCNTKVCAVAEEIQKLFPTNEITAHLYVSLTEISNTFGRHNDLEPLFIWQCIGITRWYVWDDKEYTYDLMPGDFLYIPARMDHNTKPITPRAAVSFGVQIDKN